MPRLTRKPVPTAFNDLRAEASALGENNDCSVKAVAILTGLPYAKVHAAFAAAGRVARKGTPHAVTDRALAALGFKLVPFGEQGWTKNAAGDFVQKWEQEVLSRYPGAHKNMKGLTSHQPARFPQAWAGLPNMLIETRGHHLAFKDGAVVDWSVNSARRIIRMSRLERI